MDTTNTISANVTWGKKASRVLVEPEAFTQCKHNFVYKKNTVINSHFLRYQSNLIGLSIVITTSKYIHVSIHVAAAGSRHGGRDIPIHVKHLPSEKWKKEKENAEKLLIFTHNSEVKQPQESACKSKHSWNVIWLQHNSHELKNRVKVRA